MDVKSKLRPGIAVMVLIAVALGTHAAEAAQAAELSAHEQAASGQRELRFERGNFVIVSKEASARRAITMAAGQALPPTRVGGNVRVDRAVFEGSIALMKEKRR